MSSRVAVALGSNLGDRLENLRRAVARLEGLGRLEAVSSLYETEPVGGPQQGPYLNAVAVLTTDLDPHRLLAELQGIETQAGRVRRERWGARTLDLDIIAVRDERDGWIRSNEKNLQLPHPRAHSRRFVLEPLAEVWPAAEVGEGRPAAEYLRSVEGQEVELLGRDWIDRRRWKARAFLAAQLGLFGAYGAVLMATADRPGRRPTTLVGAALALAGAGLAASGVGSLRSAASPYPEPRPGTELVAHGPYRLVRHPIYSGLILASAGLALAVRSWAGLVGSSVLAWFFSSKAEYEEYRCRLAVPGYAAYQKRVFGRLLPRTKGPTTTPGSC